MATETQYPAPSVECLTHCSKLAIVDDKPIMMDYWADSLDKKVLIGVRETERNSW